MFGPRRGGPFGRMFGPGFGDFGPGGFNNSRFERGDLKLVVLDLLKDQPRHGYDIIQELEKRFHGFYSPSPGSVYPILQLLEDQDLVLGDQQSGKKVYKITKEGEKFLADHADEIKNMHSRVKPQWGEDAKDLIHELRDEIAQTAKLIFGNAMQGAFNNQSALMRLHEAFSHFRKEIETIIDDEKYYKRK